MKKVLTILSLMAFTVGVSFALDGDTYRAEREHVEGLANSQTINAPAQTGADVNASSTTASKPKKKRRFWGSDPTQYYYFGAFTKFKGSNGQ